MAVLTASTSGYVVMSPSLNSSSLLPLSVCFAIRIGYSMAKKMVVDGAKVMLSSRKSDNVEQAVKQLRSECEGVSVEGVVCHVGKDDHRKNLIKEVSSLNT